MLDFGLYIFYVLLLIAVVAAIVFFILNTIRTPGAFVKVLISVGGLAVLFIVAYALSSSNVSAKNMGMVSETGSRFISAGLIMFYITLIGAVLAIIYSEITKAFR